MKHKIKVITVVMAALLLGACSFFGGEKISDGPERVNVALDKPVEASSLRDRPDEDQYYPPELAVDGIWTTKENRWLTNGAKESEEPVKYYPHWLIIDLQGAFSIDGAEVWTGDYTSSSNFAVKHFKLQYWKDEEWVDIPGAEVNDNEDEHVVFDINPPVVTDQIRFWSEENTSLIRVSEIIVYGVPVEESDDE